jgi:hypothetical protein
LKELDNDSSDPFFQVVGTRGRRECGPSSAFSHCQSSTRRRINHAVFTAVPENNSVRQKFLG